MPARKKLRRIPSEKKIAGVCAGLAEYFEVDVVLVRAIFLFLLVPGGLPGLIPYLILWIVMPKK